MTDCWSVDDNGFIKYQTSQADIDKAVEEYNKNFKDSNRLNGRTVYEKEESRIAGILGEIVFGHYAGEDAQRVYNMPYDFISGDNMIDVKCKFRTVVPRLSYEASDFNYQNNTYSKDVTHYAFLSTITNYKYVWFCAWADRELWWHNPNGVLWKKGETDPTNRKLFHEDTWSVFYRNLNRFGFDFREMLNG